MTIFDLPIDRIPCLISIKSLKQGEVLNGVLLKVVLDMRNDSDIRFFSNKDADELIDNKGLVIEVDKKSYVLGDIPNTIISIINNYFFSIYVKSILIAELSLN